MSLLCCFLIHTLEDRWIMHQFLSLNIKKCSSVFAVYLNGKNFSLNCRTPFNYRIFNSVCICTRNCHRRYLPYSCQCYSCSGVTGTGRSRGHFLGFSGQITTAVLPLTHTLPPLTEHPRDTQLCRATIPKEPAAGALLDCLPCSLKSFLALL